VSAGGGQNSSVNGIVSGCASGNLTFTANRWGGTANPGEFEISGTQFTPHRLVTTRKYYYAGGQRIAMRESGAWSPAFCKSSRRGFFNFMLE
jgi:hypothetical protein